MGMKNKIKRKPRRAKGTRNFGCCCGKAYLSYPALYTHVKNKHDGEFPIGSNSKRILPNNTIDNFNEYFVKDIKYYNKDLNIMLNKIDNSKNDIEIEITKNDI